MVSQNLDQQKNFKNFLKKKLVKENIKLQI